MARTNQKGRVQKGSRRVVRNLAPAAEGQKVKAGATSSGGMLVCMGDGSVRLGDGSVRPVADSVTISSF